jgi:hypothetical protein
VDPVEDCRAEHRAQHQENGDVYRRAGKVRAYEAQVRNLEQAAGDHRGVTQAWGSAPDSDADPTRTGEQRFAAGELLWTQMHVAAETLDQRSPATPNDGVQAAGPDRGSHRQHHEGQPESRQRQARHRADPDDLNVCGNWHGDAKLLDHDRQKNRHQAVPC